MKHVFFVRRAGFLVISIVLLLLIDSVFWGPSPALGSNLQLSGSPGSWTKYTGNPVLIPNQPWEGGQIWAGHVIRDGTLLKMWYGGVFPSHIGYATSSDGVSWSKLNTNPVLSPGSGTWDTDGVSEPFVMKEGSVYKMWYWGRYSDTLMQIGFATSPDGINWTKDTLHNPVVRVGDSGTFDAKEVGTPWVLHQGTTYKMWYTGQDSLGHYAIGYATSSDEIGWIKHSGTPIFVGSPGGWDSGGVLAPSIFYDGSIYRMWYFGKNTSGQDQIGYATSADGIVWTKQGNSPVLAVGPSDAWDSKSLSFPKVILENGVYKMWYTGGNGVTNQEGYATAVELLHALYLPYVTANASFAPPFVLDARVIWADSGKDVTAAKSFTITASGTVRTASPDVYPDAFSGPDGQATACFNMDGNSPCVMDGVPYGALVGKIGLHGPPFLIGSNFTFTPGASGRLYLVVNDNLPYYADNDGSFDVAFNW